MSAVSWVKTHKLTTFLIIVIIILILRSSSGNKISYSTRNYGGVAMDSVAPQTATMSLKSVGSGSGAAAEMIPNTQPAPISGTNRLVIQESYLSLLVKSVAEVRDNIISYAQKNGGYMVNSQTSNPQDAPSATVSIRLKSDKLKEALTYFHSLGVKVVSENLTGYDVTDQYVDIDKHIALLETTKAKYQSILDQAKEVSDITNLNQQIIYTQDQIDSYKGQQLALKQNADLAKVTVYLSTDEIALPYAPSETWRPEVIFKEAVRSLVSNLRKFGSDLIWIGVYAIIWIPLGVIAYFIYRFMINRNTPPTTTTRRQTSN